MERTRTMALLAVIRIVAVLGMAFAVALGIFMLLGGWWIPGIVSLIAFLPFFTAMRYMEKRAALDDQADSSEA